MRITEFEVTMDLMCWKGITSTSGTILIASVHYPMHCNVLAAMPMKYWPRPLYTYDLGGMYLPRVVYIGYRPPYCAILITCTLSVMTEYQHTHPQVPTAYTVHCTWSLTTMQFSLMRRDVSVEKRKSLRCNWHIAANSVFFTSAGQRVTVRDKEIVMARISQGIHSTMATLQQLQGWQFTPVEPLHKGYHWNPAGCPV